jgi:hypothetical protein
MLKIINDLIDIKNLDQLHKEIFSTNFPWFFYKQSINSFDFNDLKELYYTPAVLGHVFVINGQINSKYHYMIEPILDSIANRLQSTILLMRANANLLIHSPTPIEKSDIPHIDIDITSDDCYTAIFYIHDNEFPTTLYNETTNDGTNIDFLNLTIKEKIYPKSNMLAMWKADNIHSAPSFTNEPRVVINLNFRLLNLK